MTFLDTIFLQKSLEITIFNTLLYYIELRFSGILPDIHRVPLRFNPNATKPKDFITVDDNINALFKGKFTFLL